MTSTQILELAVAAAMIFAGIALYRKRSAEG